MCKVGKDSPFYSLTNFNDMATFAATLGCGFFTLSLLVQTANYVRKQSSIVDEHKQRHSKDPQKVRKPTLDFS